MTGKSLLSKASSSRPLRALLPQPALGARGLLTTWLIIASALALAWFIGAFVGLFGPLFQAKPALFAGLLGALLLGMLFLLNRPVLLLGLLLLRAGMDPLLDLTQIPLGPTAMGLGGVLNGLIVLLTATVALEHKPRSWRDGVKLFAPFLVILVIALLRSPIPAEAAKQLLSIVTFFCTFLLGAYLAQEKGYAYVLRLVVFSSIAPIAVSAIMLATGWKFGFTAQRELMDGSEAGRFAGPFSHSNIFAFYLLCVIIAALHLRTVESARLTRAYLNVTLLTCLGLLIATKTRSAWAACVVVFLVHATVVERKFFFYIAVGAVAALLVPDVQERLIDLKDNRSYLAYAKLDSYEWRKVLWRDGISSMQPSAYIAGYGLSSFYQNTAEFFSLYGGLRYGAHSVYVQLFYETGVAGVTAFGWLMVGLLAFYSKILLRQRAAATTGFCLVAIYLLCCYSDNVLGYLVFNIYIWLSLGSLLQIAIARNATHQGN